MKRETNWTWNKYLWSHPNSVENNNQKWHLGGVNGARKKSCCWTLNRGPSSISKGFFKNHGKNMDKTTIGTSVLYCAPIYPYRNLTARKSPEIVPKPNRKGWFFKNHHGFPGVLFAVKLPFRYILKCNLYKVGVSASIVIYKWSDMAGSLYKRPWGNWGHFTTPLLI